jgi:hypothetical protein
MTAALFDPLNVNLFQALVWLLIAFAIGWVSGAAWAGDRREETDLHFAGRDLQGEARRGDIDRRRVPRTPHVRHPKMPVARSTTSEPNREWLR